MPEVFELKKLKFSTLSRLILWIFSVSNLNSFSFFRIPGYSALRSDSTHFQTGILSSDDPLASGSVITFVRQGLSFSKLSTYSLSLLNSNSDYAVVHISLNNSSSLTFLNIFALLRGIAELPPFSLYCFFLQTFFHSGGLQLPLHFLRLKRYF